METNIRLAQKSDLPQYTELLQKTYQDAYVDEVIGLSKECFSGEVFNTPDTQKYLESNLEINEKQKCWLAFLDLKLVGSITIIEGEEDYELRGFYIAPDYQGRGIGKKLWELVLSFAKDKDITLDVSVNSLKTIEMYKKWGFEIDTKKEGFFRHWPEWPEGIRAKYIYMRRRVKK